MEASAKAKCESRVATSNDIISFRRHDLDNLRTWLTGLVVAHHTAIAYGGAGNWWKSATMPAGMVSPPLVVFNAFNQSFFMGLFFCISGRVSAQSLLKADRSSDQGRWGFVKSKVLRLGVPALAYTVAVQPLIRLVGAERWDMDSLVGSLTEYFVSLRGIKGTVWYTATLLFFDLGAAWLKPVSKGTSSHAVTLDYRTLAGWGWVAVAGTSFIVRLWYPVGSTFYPLSLQLAFAAQYIFAYALGHLWYDQEKANLSDISKPPDQGPRKPTGFRALDLRAAIFLSLLSMTSMLDPTSKDGIDLIWGGWNFPALLYAIWNEFSFLILGPALLLYFERRHNQPTKSTIFRPRYSYAVFLAHGLISTTIEVAIDRLILGGTDSRPAWLDSSVWKAAGPLVMTTVVGAINIGASFAVGRILLDFVPGLKRVL